MAQLFGFWALPQELLELWHQHRTPIILSTVVVLSIVRVWLHVRFGDRESETPTKRPPPALDSKAPLGPSSDREKILSLLPLNDRVNNDQKQKVQRKVSPKRVAGKRRKNLQSKKSTGFDSAEHFIQPIIFFSSLGGTTEQAAHSFGSELKSWMQSEDPASKSLSEPIILDLSYTEYDDFFISPPKSEDGRNVKYLYLILLPTYDIDTIINNFLEHLKETHNDFRINTAPLSELLGYSVFGMGDRDGWPTEADGFCSQAREVDKWMAKLTGRKRAFPLGMGDVKRDAKERLREWKLGVQDVILDIKSGKGLGDGVVGSGDAVESDEEDIDETPSAQLDDVEDLGKTYKTGGVSKGPIAVDFTTHTKTKKDTEPAPPRKEMVPKTSPTYAALTKQGYTIVGSHSGVKICRWTKSALRGRGSCYKYSFYGIKSHLCMETTPSLSCSNKCVFCWRHGTNPVGTTWRWQVDPPEMIFEGVKAGHYKKIKMMKGVPGVRAERFAEAMQIRHCALSLVGEPIFYPYINEFTSMLHKEHISSFLVCNAQHPDQLATLQHVTQLYVSIDASNKESLRKIDRPLHRDFWERFERCLDILREKRFMQRTVFRLTLVKGFNIEDEAEGYADLVVKGLPCFVEVKGVTFCGTSTSSSAGLTMQNVPFYEEVCVFVIALSNALEKRGLSYGIAAEHAHSCCVLLGDTARFRIEGKWHTQIGYEKFFKCLESGQDFGPENYIGDATPEWALWGHGGFDPKDQKVDYKGRKQDLPVSGARLVEI